MKWSHIFSCEVHVILFSFSFIRRYFDLVSKFLTNNDWFHSTELFALEVIIVFIHIFLKKTWTFGGFLSVPHLVDIYAKNVDERGRNFMCERTLLSVWWKFSFPGCPDFSLIINDLNLDTRRRQNIDSQILPQGGKGGKGASAFSTYEDSFSGSPVKLYAMVVSHPYHLLNLLFTKLIPVPECHQAPRLNLHMHVKTTNGMILIISCGPYKLNSDQSLFIN